MTTRGTSDTLIIGGGLVGFACAAALARDGASAIVLDEPRPGMASTAAAGMLAPSVDRADAPERHFAVAARDRFPDYLAWLRDATGIRVPLNTNGILQVAVSAAGVRGLRRGMPASASWLDAPEVRAMEPELAHALGAVHHPHDGAVDNVILLEALRTFAAASGRVRLIHASVLSVTLHTDGASVRTHDRFTYAGRYVILAGGAWAASVGGLPRPVPVRPVRGQMLAYPAGRLRHVLFGPRGYVIPREVADVSASLPAGETLVGSTTETVGFDPTTTAAGATRLRSVAAEIMPIFQNAVPHRHWSGLRPMTPDLLPIIGMEPDAPSLIYACGHSRNGILMAPLTGECVSALVRGRAPSADLAPFSISRFGPPGAADSQGGPA